MPTRAKARILRGTLRAAEAPLFTGIATVFACSCRIAAPGQLLGRPILVRGHLELSAQHGARE